MEAGLPMCGPVLCSTAASLSVTPKHSRTRVTMLLEDPYGSGCGTKVFQKSTWAYILCRLMLLGLFTLWRLNWASTVTFKPSVWVLSVFIVGIQMTCSSPLFLALKLGEEWNRETGDLPVTLRRSLGMLQQLSLHLLTYIDGLGEIQESIA